MDTADTLSTVKVVSFIVTGFTALWGLVAKTTYEDEQKRRRLTTAGFLAAALAIGSATLGGVAYMLERTVEREKQAAVLAAKMQEKRDQANATALQDQARAFQTRLLEAEIRSGTAQQRIATALQFQEAGRKADNLHHLQQIQRLEEQRATLVSSQALRSLQFEITVSGLSAAQRQMVRTGLEDVEQAQLNDDVYRDLRGAPLAQARRALARRYIGYPLLSRLHPDLRPGAPEGEYQAGSAAALLISLDSAQSIVLPIGQVPPRALPSEAWERGYLEESGSETCHLPDAVCHDQGPGLPASCDFYDVGASPDGGSVTFSGVVTPACMAGIIHAAEGAFPTAAIPRRPQAVFLRAGRDGLAVERANAQVSRLGEPLCWQDASRPTGGARITISLTPNGQPGLRVVASYRLGQAQDAIRKIDYQGTRRDEYYGFCAPLI